MNSDIEVVDEETGEISVDNSADPKTETLPRLARAMRAVQKRIADIEAYQRAEVERVESLCQNRTVKLREQLSSLQQMSEGVFGVIGEKKLEYPGLGVFRLGKIRVSVDSTVFDSMEKPVRDEYAANHKHIFGEKVSYSPDKDKIKTLLSAGEPVDGFSLSGGGEKMVFVPEGE